MSSSYEWQEKQHPTFTNKCVTLTRLYQQLFIMYGRFRSKHHAPQNCKHCRNINSVHACLQWQDWSTFAIRAKLRRPGATHQQTHKNTNEHVASQMPVNLVSVYLLATSRAPVCFCKLDIHVEYPGRFLARLWPIVACVS